MKGLRFAGLLGREVLVLAASFALTAALLLILAPLTPLPEKPREFFPIRLQPAPTSTKKAEVPSPPKVPATVTQPEPPVEKAPEPEPEPVPEPEPQPVEPPPPPVQPVAKPETPPEPIRIEKPEPEPQRALVPEQVEPQTIVEEAPKQPVAVAPEKVVEAPLPPKTTQAEPQGPFQLADIDQPPGLMKHFEPVYPRSARRRQIEGSVVVRFVVDKQGLVSDVSIVSAEPEGIFEDSVLQAVQKWRFEPGQKDGKAVQVLVEAPIRFQLRR